MSTSHDQNFKNLILDYPREALAFFAAEVAAHLGPDVLITPIRQELPKDRLSDRFFELDVPLKVTWPDGRREAIIFLLEEESDAHRFSIYRMAVYCAQVAETCETDRVVPVVIFLRGQACSRTRLRLGSEGRIFMHFTPLVCELGRLHARDYFDSDNIVTRITLPCMRHKSLLERVDACGKATQGLLSMEADVEKVAKYGYFIKHYAKLDETGQRLYAERYATEERRMVDVVEQLRAEGKAQGIQQGVQQGVELGVLQGKQQLLIRQLETRFGPLDEVTRERLKVASGQELDTWAERVLDAPSLAEVLRVH